MSKELSCLLFVAVEAVYGRDGPEEAVLFAVGAGSEEHSVGRSSGPIVSECEGPQAVNEHKRVIGILYETDEFMREAVERSDPAAAEIADENGVAELAKITRGPNDAPRGVEPVAVLEVADVLALGGKEFDEPETSAADRVMPGSVLLGVSDKESPADVLDGQNHGGRARRQKRLRPVAHV